MGQDSAESNLSAELSGGKFRDFSAGRDAKSPSDITDHSQELHFLGMIIAYSIITLSKKYYKRNINFKNV